MKIVFALLISVSLVYAGKPPILWFRMQNYYEVSNATIKPAYTVITNDVFGQSFSNMGKFQAAMFSPVAKTNAKILKVSPVTNWAEMSVGFWYYPLYSFINTTMSPNTGSHFFLGYPAVGRMFTVWFQHGSGINCYCYDSGGGQTGMTINNKSISGSNWHYFLLTISDNTKANLFCLYIDGILYGSTATGRATGGFRGSYAIGMLEGNNAVGADAYIDNFMMWNYVLTSNEHVRARSAERGAFHDN